MSCWNGIKNQIFQLIKTNKNFNPFNCLPIKDVIFETGCLHKNDIENRIKIKKRKYWINFPEYSFKCQINMRTPLSTSSLIKKKCIRKSLYYLALILCSNQKHGSTIKHNITSFIFSFPYSGKIKKLDLKNIYARI